MYSLIAFLLAFLVAPPSAWAQAPAEERQAYVGNTLGDAQQRVEFARQVYTRADSRTGQAEVNLKAVNEEMKAAQKQLDGVRAREDKAKKELAEARAASAGAKKNFDHESGELERIRGGGKKP